MNRWLALAAVLPLSIAWPLHGQTARGTGTNRSNTDYWSYILGAISGGLEGYNERKQQQELSEYNARQRAIMELNEQLMRQSFERQVLLDAEASKKREAAYRIFQPKVDETILFFVDSLGLRGRSAIVASGQAISRAQDIFLATPDATESRIREDLKPLFQPFARRSNAFLRTWNTWVETKGADVADLTRLQKEALVDAALVIRDPFIAGDTIPVLVDHLDKVLQQLMDVAKVCGSYTPTSCRLLRVETDSVGEPIFLDGSQVGTAPANLAVRNAYAPRLGVGVGDYAFESTVSLSASPYTNVKIRTTRRRGPPAPSRNALTDELAPLLPITPSVPTIAVAPSPPKIGRTLLLTGVIGAAAAAATSNLCESRARAPEPFGGISGSTYFPPGTVSSTVKTRCFAVSAGAGSLASILPLHWLRGRIYASRKASYTVAKVQYERAVATRAAVSLRRSAMIDSALVVRQAAERRVTITRAIATEPAVIR
jgi:hypothetical protein